MDAVVVIDAEGLVVEWNPAAESIFGHTAARAVERELASLIIPPELREVHRQGLARAVAGGSGGFIGRHVEVEGQRADGRRLPVELTITWIGGRGERALFSAFLRDITERRRMIAELDASRSRLVAVADEARRQMERDLHDGAQQQLVALAITLSGLESQVDGHAQATALTAAREMAASAIRELRDLARGIHPAVLTEHGLAAAVRELGRRAAVDVDLRLEVPDRLRADAEVAVYYVVAEALTNAAKHGAVHATVHVWTVQDRATVVVNCTVSDDGPGGDDPKRGTGLRGLADRVDAASGQLSVVSPSGGGTVVAASIPTEPR